MADSENIIYSRVVGFISLACWICVTIPQLYENYKRKSGSSVSLALIYIWIMGELLDLIGAILQNLLLTVILIALYNVLIDTSLLLQTYYYCYRKTPDVDEPDNKSDEFENNSDESENKSNESNNISDESTGEFIKPDDSNVESQMPIRQSRFNPFLKTLAGLFVICLIGGIAYLISYQTETKYNQNTDLELKLLPQIFGWSSATCYFVSRIPQVIKNYKAQSTEGLSLAMFCYCALGNITFCLSIIIYSVEFKYLLGNLPWLVGNGSALLFDCTIMLGSRSYNEINDDRCSP
ncbi:5619_t:CDS:2 [Cetraspora pellucida]|uniref:5619_t:CDS:1 n=1 Tax=Cetraspora pellucida TaxID=1433469 RepID=A0A9N9EVA1_9GLOM|nr:5619_t:CDS:2 [Cetraspora pellucida]